MTQQTTSSNARKGIVSMIALVMLFCSMTLYSLNAEDAVDHAIPDNSVQAHSAVAPPDGHDEDHGSQPASSSSSEDKAVINIAQPEHDFGETWIGADMSHTFEVRNDGGAALKLLSVKPSCGCTVAKGYDREIAPGQVGKIPVTINSKKLKGKFTKTITVTTNDERNSRITLKISGDVKHYIEVLPRSSINMGTIKQHEEKTDVVKLVNNSDKPLELTLAPSDSPEAFEAQLKEIKPGKEFELQVTAAPPFKEGRNRSRFVVNSNIPEQSELTITAFCNVLERLQVNPSRLPITTAMPRETTKSIRLTNNGNVPVALTSATSNDEKLIVRTEEIDPGKEYVIRISVPADYAPPQSGKEVTLKLSDPQKPIITVPIMGPRPNPRQLVGKPAPDVEFETHSGSTLKTSDINDAALVLFFYASWCPHCKNSLPHVEKVYQDYKDKGVRIVAVNLDDPQDRNPRRRFTTEQALEKLNTAGVTFDVTFDRDRHVGEPFIANRFPSTFVLSKSGKVIDHIAGAITGANVQRLTSTIDRALADTGVESASQPATNQAVSGTN